MGETRDSVSFSRRMRVATRKVHDISDKLVNAKLGLAMSNDSVFAEGILVFFPTFRYLEGALDRCQDSLLGQLDVDGMRRLQAFEADLRDHFGADWTDRVDRLLKENGAVRRYLDHLEEVERENPILLSAYIYHLYMGLWSGGQILNLKRQVAFSGRREDSGSRLFSLDGGNGGPAQHTVKSLKRELRAAVDQLGQELDQETQDLVINEGITVFQLNNGLVRSVRGVDDIFWAMAVKWTCVAAIAVAFIAYIIFWLL